MLSMDNGILKVTIASKGGELQSIFDIANQYEWLWQGDPAHWNKRAPILFPFIGCVKSDSYTFEGKSYPMTKHGFARDLSFELIKHSDTCIEAILKSNAQTLVMYPFDFEFKIIYELVAHQLIIRHVVTNLDAKNMPFSLGAHPAFNCTGEYTDWQVEFETPEDLISKEVCLKNGLIGNGQRTIGKSIKNLVLMHELFERDAIVFEGLHSQKVVLKGFESWQQLGFDFTGFPIFALWSPNTTEAPFVCLEPWYGMADPVDHNGNLAEKPKTVVIKQKDVFEAVINISLGGF